jgi:hypothetical protein
MQSTNLWIIVLAIGMFMLSLALCWALRRTATAAKPLPSEWAVTARPVFNADERRVYRLLKEALPHHVILSKLPLVRFCQPTEANEVRYWFDLLGATHVTFAICSPNGRVLAAVDLDSERSIASRSLQIKQSVLGACRVRYLRCPIDKLPSAAELQMLVPFNNSSARGPQAATLPGHAAAPRSKFNSATPRRAAQSGPHGLWQDSAIFQDSFFAPDSRFDSAAGQAPLPSARNSEPPPDATPHSGRGFGKLLSSESDYPLEAPNDIVGMVVDSPRYGGRPPR